MNYLINGPLQIDTVLNHEHPASSSLRNWVKIHVSYAPPKKETQALVALPNGDSI
jgi:hypothetical protein